MPDKEKSDSQQVPARRDKQRSALLRVATVVGLPILSVILRLPIWFTLLLMLGLAVFLFVTPRFSEKEAPDPKRAWTQLMNSCVRLQAAYDALKRSPSDDGARRRFLTCEQLCLSLLQSHADTDWGQDSGYAAKVRDGIAALSASARAECGDLAPLPGQGVKPLAEASKQGPTSGDGTTAVRPGTPAPPARPGVPATAEKEGAAAASEAAAVQPDTLAPPAETKVRPSAEEQGLTPAGETIALPPVTPAPPAPSGVPASAEREGAVAASEAPAAQPATPAPPAPPEVPAPAEEQDLTPASASVAVQPGGSSPSAKLDVSGPAERRLTPFLWLSGGVEDAAAFYVSVFKNSRVVGINRYPEASRAKSWRVMAATVCLDGQELMLLNGGPVYKPPETFQLLVRCSDQTEVDYYWERLLANGGEESAGGWLKDRFGVSWQVIPDALMELLIDPDPPRAARATEAMLKMKKIDIARLREAVDRPYTTESQLKPQAGMGASASPSGDDVHR